MPKAHFMTLTRLSIRQRRWHEMRLLEFWLPLLLFHSLGRRL